MAELILGIFIVWVGIIIGAGIVTLILDKILPDERDEY